MAHKTGTFYAIRYRLEYFVFRVIVCVVQAVSIRQTIWASNRLADLMVHVLPRKVSRFKTARQNLRIAFGDELSDAEATKIIHGMWVHLFRLVAEMIQLPRKLCLENSRQAILFRNRQEVIKALSTGRPVIVLSGHFGNWEMAMSAFGIFGFRMGVVARALDNPYLNDWFRDFRQATGHSMVLKKGGYEDLIKIVGQDGCVGMLCDQDAGSRGVFVDFFGKEASTFKSIALLALEYEAILCVGYARRLPDEVNDAFWARFEVGCEQIIDPRECDSADPVREITQQYTSALERVVRMAPEQYFWVHRRWKSEPRKRNRKRKTSMAKAA